MGYAARILVLLTVCLLLPNAARAQAALAGTVRDTSGAVLPGVTVEAASSALIERARVTVTSGAGQYRLEDLRPGTYTVTFTLQGFNALRRESVDISGSGVVTVDAELRISALEETITVIGDTPVVDVQSTRRQVTLDNETVRTIPSTATYASLLTMVPGVRTNTNQIQVGPAIVTAPIHGGRGTEARLRVDGLNIGNAAGGNQPPQYVADVANAAEVNIVTSGGLGESETAGLIMNLVPKTGGNTVSGSFSLSGFSEGMQADNFDDELRARGVTQPTSLQQVYDIGGAIGGPIRLDRLWYFLSATRKGQKKNTLNLYYNRNAGEATKWTYEPDLSRPAYSDRTWEAINGRLTLQATPRHKFSIFWDEQANCRSCTGATSFTGSAFSNISPEAEGIGDLAPNRVQQVTWSAPLTGRLLVDAGLGTAYRQWGGSERKPNPTRDLIRVVEQGAIPLADGVSVANLQYRAQNWMENSTNALDWRAAASYVTGAHSLKIGYQGNWWKDDRRIYTNSQALQYTMFNGTPTTITQSISPFEILARARQTSVYAQDQWSVGRVTLQGALRYDRAWSYFPAQMVGPTRFLPNAISFDETTGVDAHNDVSPRMGVAWDIFGNGKTALKANLGRYLAGASSSGTYYAVNPVLRLPAAGGGTSNPGVARVWTDADGDLVPDCDLLNRGRQDLRAAGGDLCGPLLNQAFGTTTLVNTYDENPLRGWGVRPSDWATSVSVQQEIFPRASVEVAYHRRWFRGLTVTDNLAVGPEDFTTFSITAPSDPRLPNGGGYSIDNLMAITQEAALRIPNNFLTAYENDYRWFNGVDVTVSVRAADGLTIQGGTSTGTTRNDTCEIRRRVPESAPLNPYCRDETPWLTQLRGLATYRIPRLDVVVSSVFQDKPGAPGTDGSLAANYRVSAAQIGAILGRPFAGGAFATINLVEPQTMFGDRIRQLDLGLKKRLSFGRTRTTIGVDFFNVLNSNVTLTYSSTYVPAPSTVWLNPTEYMNPRITRLVAEFTW
jgi:hypothetical protein